MNHPAEDDIIKMLEEELSSEEIAVQPKRPHALRRFIRLLKTSSPQPKALFAKNLEKKLVNLYSQAPEIAPVVTEKKSFLFPWRNIFFAAVPAALALFLFFELDNSRAPEPTDFAPLSSEQGVMDELANTADKTALTQDFESEEQELNQNIQNPVPAQRDTSAAEDSALGSGEKPESNDSIKNTQSQQTASPPEDAQRNIVNEPDALKSEVSPNTESSAKTPPPETMQMQAFDTTATKIAANPSNDAFFAAMNLFIDQPSAENWSGVEKALTSNSHLVSRGTQKENGQEYTVFTYHPGGLTAPKTKSGIAEPNALRYTYVVNLTPYAMVRIESEIWQDDHWMLDDIVYFPAKAELETEK